MLVCCTPRRNPIDVLPNILRKTTYKPELVNMRIEEFKYTVDAGKKRARESRITKV
jgi:hypothetical protein